MKNFIVKTTIGNIQIDADELPKYLEAKRKRSIVVFRQGIFDGNLISLVVEDYNRKKEYHIGHEEKTRSNFSNDRPLPDLFIENRKTLEALGPKVANKLLGDGE